MDLTRPEIAGALAAAMSALAAILALVVSVHTFRAQKRLQQRQVIIELWDKMCAIGRITVSSPPEVIRAHVNTLELVAVCFEADAIDRDVVVRTFGDTFVATYDEIHSHDRAMPEIRNRTGRELLMENRATCLVYEQIKTRLMSLGRVR